MKGRLGAIVGNFCIAILIVSVADAGKPVKPPGKPGGGKDGTKAECIIFTDNMEGWDSHVWLEGGQDCAIEGCCPNAGPWPRYEMTLYNVCYTSAFGIEECLEPDSVLGYVFMNAYGRNAPYEGYKVQFWTWDYLDRGPGDGDFFFQVRGGTGGLDKKTKVSVVEFLNEEATLWVYYEENEFCDWFEDDTCEPCSNGMQTGCDPRNDPDCLYPCWIEETIENVSFVKVRTADLSYTYTSDGLEIDCPNTTCPTP